MAFGFTSSFGRAFSAGERPVAITSAKQLPNLEVWYNAPDAASISIQSGGVGAWANTGNSTSHDWNSSGGNRPTYVSNIKNGLPAVNFAGNQFLTINPVAYLNGLAGTTLALVFKSSSTATGIRYATATDQTGFTWGQNGTTSWIGGFAGATYTVNTVPVDTNWHHVVITFDGTQTGNANKIKVRLDAIDNVLTFTGTAGTATTNNGYFYGGGKGTNATNATSTWIGDIGEVLIWTRALTISEVLAVEQYFTNKWAI